MPQPKLLEQYRERLRVKHYSLRTEDAYLRWVRRFIYFHAKRHPREMGGPEVQAFLSHLATAQCVSPSTQNQALSALLFLYREVLQKELPWMDGMITVRDGKGGRDRRTMLPERLLEPLRAHLARVKLVHERDFVEGYGDVYLPFALSARCRSCSATRMSRPQ